MPFSTTLLSFDATCPMLLLLWPSSSLRGLVALWMSWRHAFLLLVFWFLKQLHLSHSKSSPVHDMMLLWFATSSWPRSQSSLNGLLLQTFSIFSHDVPKTCHFSPLHWFQQVSLSQLPLSPSPNCSFLSGPWWLAANFPFRMHWVGSLRQSLTSSSRIHMLLLAIPRPLGRESLL